MYLVHLQIKNFRNYEKEEIKPHPEINYLYGENAQGKTSLLEGIYLFGTGKSMRSLRDGDLVRWGEDWFRLDAQIKRQDYTLEMGITYRVAEGKTLTINGKKEEQLLQTLGHVNIVLFSPEELQLVKGGPSQRRRFLNLLLAQTNRRYYHCLLQYQRTLQQRNNLLREICSGRTYWKEDLPVWDQQLAKLGGFIMIKRQLALARIKDLAASFHRSLSGGREELELFYKPALPNLPPRSDNPGEMADYFLQALGKSREEEIRRGVTMVGPQRDDFLIAINGRDGREFGSQGQQRTAALSIKMAELDFIREETEEGPILLLDDVMSELDNGRREFVYATLQGRGQIFVTGTSSNGFPVGGNGHRYRVVQGRIEPCV